MKTWIFAAVMASSMTVPLAVQPVAAQSREDIRESRRDVREERRELREAQRELRRDRRDWRQYRNYDYNRPENGRYYADNYYRDYRDDRSYRERRLGRNDRIYRGSNGRYYCRRPDGTTGLIIGAAAGGLLGNTIANGRSSTLATIIGAGAGGLLGREVERGSVRCR